MKIRVERDIIVLAKRGLEGNESPQIIEATAHALGLALNNDQPDHDAMLSELLEAVGLATGLSPGQQTSTWTNVRTAIAALSTVVPALGVRLSEITEGSPRGMLLRWVESAVNGSSMDQLVDVCPPDGARVRVPDGRSAIVRSVSYDFTGERPVCVVIFDATPVD